MKITSLKTIYLEEYELKQAIIEYLEKEHEDLAQHLYDNSCSMDWKSEYFVISIDGEIDDGGNTPERVEEQIEWLKKKAAQKVIEQHSKAFEKLADNKE